MKRIAVVLSLVAAGCQSSQAVVADASPGAIDGGSDGSQAVDASPMNADGGSDGGSDAAQADASPLGDPFAGLAALPPVCSADGWCWLEPTPSGTFYSRVVSSGPDNIWIVGGGPPGYAAILQWDGHTWITHEPPMPCTPAASCGYPEYLFPMAISTGAPGNTWLVYSNLVEHWDGTSWTIVDTQTTSGAISLDGVWVDPTGDAWVTQSDGVIKRWHAGSATVMSIGTYAGSIWGTAPNDVFVTSIGHLYHYDGNAFTAVYSGGKTAGWYQGVSRDVWISGGDGVILHWDGMAITELSTGLVSQAVVQSADYAASKDVSWLASGGTAAPTTFIHWDGLQLTMTPVAPAFTSLGDNVCEELGSVRVIAGKWWIVCEGGAIATTTGPGTIAPVIAPWSGSGQMWGTSKNDLYLATGGDLRHWDGSTWTQTPVTISGLRGLAGTGMGGANELFGTHFDYAAGGYTTYFDHFDGATWTTLPVTTFTFGQPLLFVSSVYPLGPDEAILVGGAGTAFHYQSGALSAIDAGTTVDLVGIWGPDGDHLSITGAGGTLLEWSRSNPGVFTPDPSFAPTTDDLGAIASAGGTTWIAPANQTYVWMKATGGSWQKITTPLSPVSIAAINQSNVIVTGSDSGRAARWNGTAFETEIYPSWRLLHNLYALPDGTTYLSDYPGVVVHP